MRGDRVLGLVAILAAAAALSGCAFSPCGQSTGTIVRWHQALPLARAAGPEGNPLYPQPGALDWTALQEIRWSNGTVNVTLSWPHAVNARGPAALWIDTWDAAQAKEAGRSFFTAATTWSTSDVEQRSNFTAWYAEHDGRTGMTYEQPVPLNTSFLARLGNAPLAQGGGLWTATWDHEARVRVQALNTITVPGQPYSLLVWGNGDDIAINVEPQGQAHTASHEKAQQLIRDAFATVDLPSPDFAGATFDPSCSF